MAAGVYNLDVEQGASKAFSITYKDSLDAPIDLTGYSGRGYIKLKANDSVPLAEFEISIPSPVTGVVEIVLKADALSGNANVKGSKYSEKTIAVYDIELYTANDEEVIRLLNGTCSISPEVTR